MPTSTSPIQKETAGYFKVYKAVVVEWLELAVPTMLSTVYNKFNFSINHC